MKSGQLLIGWDGYSYHSPSIGDDFGIYIIIPKLAQLLDITLQKSIDLFFYLLLLLPLVIGAIMVCLTHRLLLQKIIGVGGLLLLARFAYAVGDLYLAYYAAAVILPLVALHVIKTSNKNYFFGACLAIGLLSGLLHYIRASSYFGPFLVAVFFIVFSRIFSYSTQLKGFLLYLIGFALVLGTFEKIYADAIKDTKKKLGITFAVDKKHAFWHPMYLGLGFLNIKNEYGISYDDAVGARSVASYDPKIVIYSNQYENILRQEFFKILFADPIFILVTLFAKIGVLLFFLIKFANIGLFAAYLFRKEWWIDTAFFIGMIFNSVYVLIAVPLHEYALGFIALSVVWSLLSINVVLELFFLKNYVDSKFFLKEQK
ncbi:MAG: hypothetical protein K2X39_04310 [Silvanigrellaceae bacterium]|nr:hypothetical protein [Silvanigrellaceae bacterium]